MRVAVISDIHANWHALEAVLADIASEAPDEVWCLGDLVGYGPQPNRCTDETRARADICLIGNHDLAAVGRLELESFSPAAAVTARWTAENLEAEPRRFLEGLEPAGERDGVQMFHGSPRDPIWEYVLSEGAARAALEATSATVILVGHSHIPIALRLNDGTIAGGLARGGSELDLSEGRWLLNPGAVGQPRDGDPRAAYLLLDLGARRAHYRRVPYDVEATQAEILENGLPADLASRLAGGE
jgi:predicted phosphodiesterase